MKRALSLALAFVLALTLTACGKKDTGTDSDSNVPTDALTLLNTVWTATRMTKSSPPQAATMSIPWTVPPVLSTFPTRITSRIF